MARQKPTAIVLAGTYPHIRLLQNLSCRGYRTVLVDYYEAPCAKPHADHHIQASTLDRKRVLEIAKAEGASLVISSCADQANLIACLVSEELDLPCPYDSERGAIVTNKLLMKQFMMEFGIPTSQFISVKDTFRNQPPRLRYPLIVKPSDSNGSKGVARVDSPRRLKKLVRIAIELSRAKEAVIEEFVEGREVGIDFYVNEGEPVVLITKERRKIPGNADSAQQIFGCFWPATLTEYQLEEVIEIARKIAGFLGLRNTPLMIQFIIGINGLYVIEFAARFGGGESFKIIEMATGIDIIDLSICSFMQEAVHIEPRAPRRVYAETFIYAEECDFGRIEVQDSLLMDHTIDYVHQYKTEGMRISKELTSNNRAGCFIVSGQDIAELRTKIGAALDGIRVADMNGRQRFRIDLYRHETMDS